MKDIQRGKIAQNFDDEDYDGDDGGDDDNVRQSQVWKVGRSHKYICHSVTDLKDGQLYTLLRNYVGEIEVFSVLGCPGLSCSVVFCPVRSCSGQCFAPAQ